MSNLAAIAKNTFKQAVRDKILYGILVFALLFLGSIVVLGSLSLGENGFVVRSFGLAGIYIFGLIITIFLGASTIYEEIEKKTTYFLLSKPVTRGDIIVGKFLGLLAAISVTTLLMLVAYLLIIKFNVGLLDYLALEAVLLQLLEMGILIAVIILFSIFTTPLAAIIYTILVLYIGHLLSLIREFASKSAGISEYILMLVYYLFPNLEKFNIRNLVVHQVSISPKEFLASTGYALIYITLTLYVAKLLFNRKEL
ncbi:MAG: ABC transporter permease subunit [bacterium]|nr:ABC transporter permease subunit [bacterium]